MSDDERSDSGPEEPEADDQDHNGASDRTVPKIAVGGEEDDVGEDEEDGRDRKKKPKGKGSYKEQSAAFQDVLSKSSRYRHQGGGSELRTPRRLDALALSPRGSPDDMESPISPRSPRQERHLARGQLGQRSKDDSDTGRQRRDRPRVVDLDDPSEISPALRKSTDRREWGVGRAPVKGLDRNKLNDIETFSSRPGELSARIKLSSDDSRSAPNSPRMAGKSPMLARRENKISLDNATNSLGHGRTDRRQPPLGRNNDFR